MTAEVVTVGRGHDTHVARNANRTLCGKSWTDEHPPETRVTCLSCRALDFRPGKDPTR